MSKSPFPKRLKEARTAAGISQKQLGIKAGIDEFSSSARMNQYEKGTHAPDFDMVYRIAKVLKVPTPYFYAETRLAKMILLFGKLKLSQKEQIMEDMQNT